MDKQSVTEQNSGFANFSEFYPYYLQEHANRHCRQLHFVGSWLVLAVLIAAVYSGKYTLLWLIPVVGYGFAWVGHFFFEHNKPATFKHPFYSLMGDWVMFADILRGRVTL